MKRSALNTYDNYPKNIFAKNMLYYNMSHHYRRLYNAKPSVDTSSPISFKLLKKKDTNSSNKGCEKNSVNLRVNGKSILKNNEQSCGDGKKIGCLAENKKNSLFHDLENAPFHPKVLKTNVSSKIRNSRNYYPPRKKGVPNPEETRKKDKDISSMVSWDVDNKKDENCNNEYEDDVDWLQLPSQDRQETRSSSKPSSSDSAYTEEGEGLWSGGESRDDSPQQMHLKDWSTRTHHDKYNVTDRRYVVFLRSITDEVLRKGIYTNKALKKVFQEHIHKNRHKLDVKRMQEEVNKLQEDLGIPKNDDLDDVDFGLGCGVSDHDDLDYILCFDRRNKTNDRFSGCNDFLITTELTESIDQLNLISPIVEDPNEVEDWLNNKVNTSLSTSHNINSSEGIKLPLKIPIRDDDNDSSIGCEILSSSSDNGLVIPSNERKLAER